MYKVDKNETVHEFIDNYVLKTLQCLWIKIYLPQIYLHVFIRTVIYLMDEWWGFTLWAIIACATSPFVKNSAIYISLGMRASHCGFQDTFI